MQFPPTNKKHRKIEDQVGDNAKLLEELLDRVQWRRFFNIYCVILGILLATIFLIIVTVRFAIWLF